MVVNKKKGKWYDPALKAKAMGLADEIGSARAAKVLGIDQGTVNKWVCRQRDGRTMGRNDTPEQRALGEANRKLKKLERENEDLKKANIILKELASFFSKDRPHTDSEWSLNSQKFSKNEN